MSGQYTVVCIISDMTLTLSDEGALVKGVRKLGFVFTTRTPDSVAIEVVSSSEICLEAVFS